EKARKHPDEAVCIIWSGNSQWGEYAGHTDYKGLRSVIDPALSRLRSDKVIDFEFICLDSAIKKVSNKDVLREMRRADILLISSKKEGTPLTLIEAMANSCAVITTDVGIA